MLVGVPREVKDHEYRVSTIEAIEQEIATADVVIGAVLIPGASAPKLVTRDMLNLMKPRAVLVDVAIDQGGCFETSSATTYSDPTYEVDGIVHYSAATIPSAVPLTSRLPYQAYRPRRSSPPLPSRALGPGVGRNT